MMSLGISYAKILEDDFSILLSSIAQDCYDSSKKIYVDGKKVSANIYKDSSAVDKFQRMLVSEVSNASDIDAAIEELKRFGYGVSSKSEKIAFNKGLKLLE